MNKANVLVITGDGLNCENETLIAFQKAGSSGEIININSLLENPTHIHNFNILAIPGGFSFGDEINSGQILALKIKHGLAHDFNKFIEDEKLIIGICNGFQTLTKLGLLPTPNAERSLTLTHNKSSKFIDTWTTLVPNDSVCIWTKGIDKNFRLPVRHAEGNIVFKNNSKKEYENLILNKQVPLSYAEDINGSYEKIAGLCDKSGRIFGLMPHPEAAINKLLNPFSSNENAEDIGLLFFKNAVAYIEGQTNI